MNNTSNAPNAIQALSFLSGVGEEEVAVQIAAVLTAIGGPHAGLMTLGDEFRPVGFHLLNLGGDSARQRRLTELLFSPLRFIQEDLLEYSRLAPSQQLDWMAKAYTEGKRSDEYLTTDPSDERVERTARRDVYHLADLSSQATSLTSPWRRKKDVDLFMDKIGGKTLLPVDGIHGHLPGDPMLSQSYVGRNEGQCLYHPVVFLDNPGIDIFRKPLEGVDRDSPLILDESGRLWDEASRSAPGRKTIARLLGERAFINRSAESKEQSRSGCPRIFALVSQNQGCRLLSNSEMENLWCKALLVGAKSSSHTNETNIDPAVVAEGYQLYRRTLEGLIRLRRLDATGLWWTGMEQKLAIEFHHRQQDFIEQLDTVSSGERQFASSFASLPVSLLWTISQLEDSNTITSSQISTAMDLAEVAMKNHLSLIRELRSNAETEQIERKAAEMLWKLLDVEPCSFRELIRKYPVQRREVHEPVLNHLIESGKVLRLESNRIRLADKARQELTTASAHPDAAG